MARAQSNSGFSLLELMIALALTAVVASQVLSMLSTQTRTFVAQKRVIDAQEDAQLVADMIRRDVRMAGFLVSRSLGISGVDGGTSSSDRLCSSDLSSASDATIDLAMTRFDGAALDSGLAASAGSVELVAADMDIDGDAANDFAVGSGLIIAEGTATHCARITAISSNTVSFTPATPAGFAVTVAARAVPAVIYEVTSAGLRRNNLVLSDQVEDVQVQYAVDVNDDGEIAGSEFPIHGLNGYDPGLVRGLQLSVLTRTSAADATLTGPGRPALANRNAAGADDNFRRRQVTVTVAPRNLL